MLRKTLLLVLVSAMMSLPACSSGGVDDPGAALEHQVQRLEGVDIERPWSTVDELLSFIEENHDREGFGGMKVLVGRFTDVTPGVGARWEETADGDRRILLDYGDPAAMSESVHLTFEVTERLAPHAADDRSEVTIGVGFDAGFDFDQIEKDYLALGEVVVFLKQSAAFDYQPGLYGILDDGLFIGVVDETGAVEFPLLRDRVGFFPEKLTVDDLVRP